MKEPESSSSLRNSCQKLQQPFRKTNTYQNPLSFILPALWNKFRKEIKRTTNLNAFKHDLKKHYLNELGKVNFQEKLSLLISLVRLCFYNVTIIIIVANIILLFTIFIIVNTTTVCVLLFLFLLLLS